MRVVSGRVLDIIIDLRPDSATFLQHLSVEISAENHRQLFIPKGFAHGFLTLSEQALFQYKVDNLWSKEHERSIAYNSPELKIDWPVELNRLIISEKDIAGMTLTAATAEILALQRQTLPRDLQPKNIEQPSILREK